MNETIFIERHPFDAAHIDLLIPSKATNLTRFVEFAKRSPDNLDRLARLANEYAGLLTARQPDSADLLRVLIILAQAAAAQFALMIANGQPVSYALGLGNPVTQQVPAGTMLVGAHVGRWREGFYAALITRQHQALAVLAAVPLAMLRAARVHGSEYHYRQVEMLQTFWQATDDVGSKVIAALNATHPNVVPPDQLDYVDNIVASEIDLVKCIINHQADEFNRSLVQALNHHKDYWTRHDRQDDPGAFLALGPTALAAIAHDRGFALQVRSDYMPNILTKGESIS